MLLYTVGISWQKKTPRGLQVKIASTRSSSTLSMVDIQRDQPVPPKVGYGAPRHTISSLDNGVLTLKGKEVISDQVHQMEIAKRMHEIGKHSGINKTTAVIAKQYHWSRIKETVSDVIRSCPECSHCPASHLVQRS
ncbi:hypothetical protein PG989_000482 [Apiospora arundinis]